MGKRNKQRKYWISRMIRVPIYCAKLWVGVADDPRDLEGEIKRKLGRSADKEPLLDDLEAGVLWSGSRFAVVFTLGSLDVNPIGHEVFHLTHRIMQYHGEDFPTGTHEAHAYLCGWLHEALHKQFKQAGVKVKGC